MAQVKDIFISYGREEGVRAFVKSLKVGIEASGISVWLDVDDIPTGSDFHEEIGLALQSCRALVPVLTKKYTQSRYCKGELYVANGQQKILLPLVYEDGWDEGKEGAGVKLIVAAFNWAFFRPNVDDYQESLKKLVRGAKLKLNIPIGQLNVDAEGIMDALRGVKNWKELGHQLNINPEKLSILFNSGRSEEECRHEMISYWKKYDNDTSWEKLVRALLRIGENKLAEKIIEEQALSKSLTHKKELLSFGDNDNSTKPDCTDCGMAMKDDYTVEDKQAMNMTNQEEIKQHFAILVDSLRNALRLVDVPATDISRYLKDLRIEFHTPVSNINEILDYLQATNHCSYMNCGLVERLNKRFLESKSQSVKQHILEYKGRFNGFLAMEKIINSEFFVEADECGDIEDPADIVTKYGPSERHRLKVKLELGGRKLSEISLTYVAELWESLQEEYELPSLTAQIDYIMKKCLEVVWLISPLDAEKIRSSTKSHIPFFRKHHITLVTLDDHAIFKVPSTEEQEQMKEQALLEKNSGDTLFEKGKYQLAAESYSKAMELDPTNAVLSTRRAEALFQQQLYADAEQCCSISLTLDENGAKAYLIRAKARAKLGKLELAIQDFHSTLKLDPRNMEANMQSARLEGEVRRRAKRAKQECPTKQAATRQQPVKEKCSLTSSDTSKDVCELSRQPSEATSELEVAQTLDEWEITLRTLLGEKVLVSNSLSSQVPVSIFEQEGAVVGLFFSATWCPPSSEFTPKLVDWYNRIKKGPNGDRLNIVFVSSDFDDESWRDYCAEMPWYALDFKDRDKETKLAARFKVDAIPTLIFVDGSTGTVITKDGRSIVSEDPTGEQFPWRPKPFLEIVKDAEFINQDKKLTTWSQLHGKTIGLFFSAYWCPPGQQLTPTLVATYHRLREIRQDFEFIYVSSDNDEEEWRSSLSSMPWMSFHYNDKRTETLRNSFHVDSIPSLILLNERGGVITTEGLTYMFNDPDGETFPWYVNALTEFTAEEINQTAYVIWFVSSASTSRAKEVLEPLAMEYISKKAEKNMEVKLMFFIAGEENDASKSIREKAQLPRRDPLLAIIDVPRNQVHVCDHSEVTEENTKKFICDYLARRLMGRRLRKL